MGPSTSITVGQPGGAESQALGGALGFGSVADQYEAARPDYPQRLLDAVLEYADLPEAARALEIGAGTGQATAQFAWRGLAVHAIEPCAEMVRLLEDKFEGTGLAVTAEVTDLESAELEPGAYDLVYCATAWHWLTPTRRWEIVADVLRPGGTLAVFYHVPLWRQTDLRPQLDDQYRDSGAPLELMGPMLEVTLTPQSFAADWLSDAPEPGLFGDHRAYEIKWSVDLPADEYVELLGTYGDHISLPYDVRERLFSGVDSVIREAGGIIELDYATFLLLARYQPSA